MDSYLKVCENALCANFYSKGPISHNFAHADEAIAKFWLDWIIHSTCFTLKCLTLWKNKTFVKLNPGAFLLAIQFQWKLRLAVTPLTLLATRSQTIFPHAITAQCASCTEFCNDDFVGIGVRVKRNYYRISITMECLYKIKLIHAIIFHAICWDWAFSAYQFLLWWLQEYVYLILSSSNRKHEPFNWPLFRV